MNILGMGPLEVLVITLVVFILLGPQKMVDVARGLGKATKEVRRMTDELPKVVLHEELGRTERASSASPSSQGSQELSKRAGESDGEEALADGPATFRTYRTRGVAGNDENTQGQDT